MIQFLLLVSLLHGPTSGALQGEQTVQLNGIKLWYKVSGKGPMCVMPTPGWGPSSDLYFRTLQTMEKHFTVVYLDSRGTGRSGRATDPKAYHWNDYNADLEALRIHLKQDKIWLMGHSEGGMQILHYACKHPDRVAGMVVLASVAAVGPMDGISIYNRLMKRKNEAWFAEAMKLQQAPQPTSDAEMATQMKVFLPAYWADPARIEKFAEHFAATTMSLDARRGQETSKRMTFNIFKDLKNVTAPTLIVAGDKDPFCTAADARQIHLCLPNSKLLVIEDCGHFMWMEQAAVFDKQVPLFLEALGVR